MSPERARDRLGRPLPDGADPALIVPGVPTYAVLSDQDAWREGIAYLADGLPFHAHEVFEMRWRLAPESDRAAWRALAQWGAALTHEARGNFVGASRLASRARDNLESAGSLPGCIDVPLVLSSCEALSGDER